MLFCGYRVPHPLEPRVQIRVQTTGEQTVPQVVSDACDKLLLTVHAARQAFVQQVAQAKGGAVDFGSGSGSGAGAGGAGGAGAGGPGGMNGGSAGAYGAGPGAGAYGGGGAYDAGGPTQFRLAEM